MAKWWVTELQKRVVDQCLQLHGGYGFMTEYPISRRYADARVMHRRTESMSARNGAVEALDQGETVGIGVRALVGSSWGFFATPRLDAS